jgi:hypothetical protein
MCIDDIEIHIFYLKSRHTTYKDNTKLSSKVHKLNCVNITSIYLQLEIDALAFVHIERLVDST